MPGQVKVNSVWRTATGLSVKVGGQWKTVTSAFIKVGGQWKQWFASLITDTFTRSSTSSGLGIAETGQPWNAIRGDWRVSGSNNAISDSAAGSYAISAVNFGNPDVTAKAEVSIGTGVAFWVTDSGSWWASYVENTQTSTPYTYQEAYNCRTEYYAGCSGVCTIQLPPSGGSAAYCSGTCSQTVTGGITGWSYSGPSTSYFTCPNGGSLNGTYNTCYVTTTVYTCPASWPDGPYSGRCYNYAYNFYSYVNATATTSTTTYQATRNYSCSGDCVPGPNPSTGSGGPASCYCPVYGTTTETTAPVLSGSTCVCPSGYSGSPTYNPAVPPSSGGTQTYYPSNYPTCSCTSGGSGGGGAYSGSNYVCDYRNATGYNITNYYNLKLIKSESNSISEATGSISLSSAPAAIVVKTLGNSVEVKAFSNAAATSQIGSTLSLTPSSPTKGTSIGIIKAPSAANQGSTVDGFSASI